MFASGKSFNRDKHNIGSICNYMLALIVKGAPKNLFCEQLVQDRLSCYADAIKQAGAALHNCVGFIDGTNRETCRPRLFQRVYYSGHKHYHSIKFQAWCTPDGLISHLSGPIAGSKHDIYMFNKSNVEMIMCKPAFSTYCLFADQGYNRSGHLSAPFKSSRQNSEVHRTFNNMMLIPRLSVEHSFMRVTQLFPFFQKHTTLRIHQVSVAQHYFVAVYFANMRTCIDEGNQITANFANVAKPPTIEEYLAYFHL